MTLAAKWGIFLRKAMPRDTPREQLLFAQGCYLAGAQAAFQILELASQKTQDEAIIIWHDLQDEILGAVAKPQDNLVVTPPEKRVII